MKVNPIVRSIVNPIVNNIVRNVSRYFQVYNGTSSKGEFAAPKVFTGDFTASIDFATTETAVTQILIGDNDSSDHFLSLQADGEVRASINGTLATSSGIIDPRDGNLNNLTLQRVGGVFDLRLNNNSVASGNEAGDFVVSATGVYNTNLLPLKGTPANLILVDGNDRERIVNGGFDTDLSNWSITTGGQIVEWVGGQLHIVTDGTGCGVSQLALTTGKSYMVTVDYIAVSGSLKIIGSGDTLILDTTQIYQSVITAASENFYIYRNSGAAEGYVNSVSVKEITETLTFPLLADDIEYPLERDTTEHMPNGDFVTDDLTGWIPSNATQSVVNNSLELVDAGGSAHTIHLVLVPHDDTDYDVTISMRTAAGNTNPRAASVKLGGTVYRVSAEDTTENITVTVSSSNFGYIEIYCATWGGATGDTAYFSNISVQKASNYLTFTDVTLIN